jgi:hypothetical protein
MDGDRIVLTRMMAYWSFRSIWDLGTERLNQIQVNEVFFVFTWHVGDIV